ncbi:helix-turn-helix domain-containing protein [Peribacillus alkalitolerans]|uniref:helix-turn-helix domain-containing protein n=1 Tax=Peribacillus alkalitolerans TaxID=1550385 RepID=UPI0013D19973|nr:helix-turn-helix transcriptional regulator [Peribacillus alkalitolerans]
MNENFVNIGEILRSLREYKGLEIEELAEGICSEEDLILFEKDRIDPTIDQLYHFARKLNVEVSDFFDFASAGSLNYVSAVMNLIKKYKRERNYYAINEIVQKEKENPLFNFPSSRQFLLWHEAICFYYLSEAGQRDKDYSIERLYEAIEITNPTKKGLTEREIEILMAIALIEKEAQNFEKAISLLKEVLEYMEHLPSLADPHVRLRALFGIAQSLSRIGEYEESLIFSEKGIDQCINDEVLYLFGEFLYQTGLNHVKNGNLGKGKEYYTKSLSVFELQNNENLGNIVKNDLVRLSTR